MYLANVETEIVLYIEVDQTPTQGAKVKVTGRHCRRQLDSTCSTDKKYQRTLILFGIN